MSDIVKVTVIIENAYGHETKTVLAAIPDLPLLAEWEWDREPVIDHDAEARSIGFRIMKPGPNVGIKLAAYGRVIE